MDFQDALNPPVELKIPLPDPEAPARPTLDEVDITAVKKETSPDTAHNLENEQAFGNSSVGSLGQEYGNGVYKDPSGPSSAEEPEPDRSDEGRPKAIPHERPLALAEMRHIVALEQYHRKRTLSQQLALEDLTRTCGINGRLIPCLNYAHQAMADCFHKGNSSGFARTYDTCESLVEACTDHPVEPTAGNLEDTTFSLPLSWLERLPQDCQDVVISLLSSLRTDKGFFADRLTSLSFTELFDVFSLSNPSGKFQSIFQGPHPRRSTGNRRSSIHQDDDLGLHDLRSLHKGDPFFVLFHGIFGTVCTQGAKEQLLKIQIWSTACARVITKGRSGSDGFTTRTLDAFFDSSDWSLKPQLETYILKVLREGAFLLGPASKEPVDIKEPLEIRNANTVIATSNFFDRVIKDLLCILVRSPPMTMLPDGLHSFICCTLGKIRGPEVRHRARNFIVSKWFISTVLVQALIHPEACGMMMAHHIRATARDSILRQISSRLQKQVFDAIFARNTATPVLDPEMHSLVEQLLDMFNPIHSELRHGIPSASDEPKLKGQILVLSPDDIASLIRALYPKLVGSAASADPSTAGSSTLVSESPWHGEGGKSCAPSLSDVSLGDPSAYKIEPPKPWSTQLEPFGIGSGPNAADVARSKANQSRTLEDQLIRTYRCLCSTLQPLPAPNVGTASPDWAFFETDDEGNVQKSALGRTMLPTSCPSSDQRTNSVEAGNDLMKELKFSITRLLTLQTLPLEALRFPARSGLVQQDETRAEVENLIKAAIDQASAAHNYRDLHFWWQAQIRLRDYDDSPDQLLKSIYEDCQTSIRVNLDLSTRFDEHSYGLASLQEHQSQKMANERKQRKAFRTKMWYVWDVRHSSTLEDAWQVTQALRAMADSTRSKHPTGVANWARNRLRNVVGYDRTSTQILDALTEPSEYSGISKLNDDQVERTTRWLTRRGVENFCRGEERIHRFCFEIQKCANKLTGATLLESPVLWSSPLFEREKRAFHRKVPTTYEQHFQSAITHLPYTSIPYLSAPLPIIASQQKHGTSQSRVNYWMRSPHVDERTGSGSDPLKTKSNFNDSYAREPVRSLPYRVSPSSMMTTDPGWTDDRSGQSQPLGSPNGAGESFVAEMRKEVYSLLLSDLGYPLWLSGTETDSWLRNRSLDELSIPATTCTAELRLMGNYGQPLSERVLHNFERPLEKLKILLTAASAAQQDLTSRWHIVDNTESRALNSNSAGARSTKSNQSFPYRQTYKTILEGFSLSDHPETKLQRLYELEQLISHSIQESSPGARSPKKWTGNQTAAKTDAFHFKSMLVPRTKATSFEEVMANCTERRAGTMRFKTSIKTPSPSPVKDSFGTDQIVDTLFSILRDPELRPRTLFRDLQYIAAFVPAEILDQTPQGKAFWDAGLAALALKQEVCDSMIIRATDITTYHISTTSSSPTPPPTSPAAGLTHTTLRDAAELWIIAAKEGSATAARELGLLYLTHPEFLPRTTLQPFSKPKEVFKSVSPAKTKEGSSNAAEVERLDPVTFAVVFHWMEVAANGGDRDARDFLRGNGELGGGR
ncbi:MAG: hypothetical protein Q9209_002169 [Squamulea sp. 1 TL-2023]